MEWRRTILLDIKDYALKNKLESQLTNYQITKSPSLNDKNYDLILTDNDYFSVNLYKHSKRLLITNKISEQSSNFDDVILKSEVTDLLLYRINKILNPFRNNILTHGGLTLHNTHKYLKYSNSVVFLSDTEYLLIEYLLSKHNYISTKSISNVLKKQFNKEYTINNCIVLINRLKNKLLKGFGVKLIKNRYKHGYYLSV